MSEKENPKERDDRNLFVLIPTDDHEARVCKDFWDEKYPKSQAKLVTDLKLQRLTGDHVLVTLTRLPPDRPKFIRLEGGLREALPSDMPVRIGHPIRIQEHWNPADDSVDNLSIVRAIGTQVIPLRPSFSPTDLSVRLMMN